MNSDRRSFLKGAAFAATAVTVGSGVSVAAAATPPALPLDVPLLVALGDAVLPESVGAAGRARVVREFASWLAAYRPVSEQMHGYGDQEITYGAADPAPGWNAQLRGLDLLAHRRHRRGFAALDVAARRDVLRAALGHERSGALPPNPLAASHVAVALIAYWTESSEATDLVYAARIAKGNCRVLADSARKPLPLAPTEND